MKKTLEFFTCKKCKWISFTVSRKYAEEEVNNFNAYFMGLDKRTRTIYYDDKMAYIAEYERCHRCGNSYKNFRKAKKSEIYAGATIQSIIHYKE